VALRYKLFLLCRFLCTIHIMSCCCALQPSYKTRLVARQEDVSSAREPTHSSSSQFSVDRSQVLSPSSAVSHRGESVATTSVSQHRPGSASQSVAHIQRTASVVPSDPQQQQPAASHSEALPPSGKQRLICSVDVPGIGRAAKVNCINVIRYIVI